METDTIILKDLFPSSKWIDKGTYYLNISQQGTPEWLAEKAVRDTASEIGALVGKSNFKSPQYCASVKIDPIKKHFNEISIMHMNRGTRLEPIARKWYENKYNVTVEEAGLAVPKWDLTLGASPDGLVGEDGLIEIKCPERMYFPIVEYKKMLLNGIVIKQDYNAHIWREHYCQMQTAMAVMGKKWCDYIVYCENDKEIFIERINFNKLFWDEITHKREIYLNTIFIDEINLFLKDVHDKKDFLDIYGRLYLYCLKNEKIKEIFKEFKKKLFLQF